MFQSIYSTTSHQILDGKNWLNLFKIVLRSKLSIYIAEINRNNSIIIMRVHCSSTTLYLGKIMIQIKILMCIWRIWDVKLCYVMLLLINFFKNLFIEWDFDEMLCFDEFENDWKFYEHQRMINVYDLFRLTE